MKYLIITLILSCSMIPYETDNPCQGMTEYEIGVWVSNNIKYVYDWDAKENAGWFYEQSPKEVLRLRESDCDGFPILYMYLIYINLGIKYDLVIGHQIDEKYGIFGFHVFVKKECTYYEPQNTGESIYPFGYNVIEIIDYDTAMYWATNGGYKGL